MSNAIDVSLDRTGLSGGPPSRAGLTSRELRYAFAGLTAAIVLPAMNATIVSTALPAIGNDLGSLSQLPWIVTTYLMASTIAVPIVGKLSDIHGRRAAFTWVIAIFVVGSVLCGAAQSLLQLMLARAVQGAGGGAIVALTFASLADLVSARQRGKYQGYTYAAMATSSMIGPLLGGIAVDHLSWRWIFFVDVPVGLAALAVMRRHLRVEHHTEADRRVDVVGGVLLSCAVTAGFLVIGWGGDVYRWTSPAIVALLVLTGVCTVGFVLAELRSHAPLLPLAIFRHDVVAVCCAVGFVMQGVMYASIVFVPLFLQTVTRVSATQSGVLLAPLIASMLVTNVISGRLITRWGRYRAFPIIGTALTAVGLTLLSTMEPTTGRVDTFLFMMLVGAGGGMTNQVLVLAAQNAAPQRFLGVVTGGIQFSRMLGSTVGLVVLGVVLERRIRRFDLSLPGGATVDPDRLTGDAEAFLDLPTPVQDALRRGFSEALTHIFLLAAVGAVVAFALAWFLREVPLADDIDDADSSIASAAATAA